MDNVDNILNKALRTKNTKIYPDGTSSKTRGQSEATAAGGLGDLSSLASLLPMFEALMGPSPSAPSEQKDQCDLRKYMADHAACWTPPDAPPPIVPVAEPAEGASCGSCPLACVECQEQPPSQSTARAGNEE